MNSFLDGRVAAFLPFVRIVRATVRSLPFQNLHERHVGLTPRVAGSYEEAARVCLDRHHRSPQEFELTDDNLGKVILVVWEPTDARCRNAWNNEIDATEAGSSACAIAAVELRRDLYAVRRAETLSGVDYYVAPAGVSVEDMQDVENYPQLGVTGLEISGTARGTLAQVQQRLRKKVRQACEGKSPLAALACVVGFEVKQIRIATVDLP